MGISVSRRSLLVGGIGLVGTGAIGLWAARPNPTAPAASTELVLYRDPGCGCCKKWAAHVGNTFEVNVIPSTRLGEVRQRLGVPDDLAGCHTATVDGVTVEGHVPVADIQRLLRDRPAGISGLAVPGMPLGSPGMETDDGAADPYDVIAFGTAGERLVFASYGKAMIK